MIDRNALSIAVFASSLCLYHRESKPKPDSKPKLLLQTNIQFYINVKGYKKTVKETPKQSTQHEPLQENVQSEHKIIISHQKEISVCYNKLQ